MILVNGRLPDALLGKIGTPEQMLSRRLTLDLLPQTNALRAAFHDHFGKSLVVTDAYRTYEEQVALKIEKGPYAATPGTSVHGLGHAMDLGSGVQASFDSPEHRWMRENGPRFGWYHPTWAHDHNSSNGMDEPWHFEGVYVPSSSYRPVEPPPVAQPEPPIEQKDEDDMKAIILNGQPNSGIIIQAATPPYSVEKQIFDALCGAYDLTPKVLADWQYDTAVREQWTAYNMGQQFAKTSNAVDVSPAAVTQIANAVRAALPN